MGIIQRNIGKIVILAFGVATLLMVSDTATKLALSASSHISCTLTTSDLCVKLANSLSRYEPKESAKIHMGNCIRGRSRESCVSASILFGKIDDTPNVIKSLNQACKLGDKTSCSIGNRAAEQWLTTSRETKVSAKEMRSRLEAALNLYTKGCELGEGESCALAARSPLSSAKAVYSFFYRGCYSLNHPTACIGLADYFKNRGESKNAQNAVARICKDKKTVACADLFQRMADEKSAFARTPSSRRRVN